MAIIAALAGVLVLIASLIQGPPRSVPAVALGWPLILYLERVALVAGLIMGIGGTAVRMLRGSAVQGFTAPGGPGVNVADQTATTGEQAVDAGEALRDLVDAGFRELDGRVERLEDRLEEQDRPR